MPRKRFSYRHLHQDGRYPCVNRLAGFHFVYVRYDIMAERMRPKTRTRPPLGTHCRRKCLRMDVGGNPSCGLASSTPFRVMFYVFGLVHPRSCRVLSRGNAVDLRTPARRDFKFYSSPHPFPVHATLRISQNDPAAAQGSFCMAIRRRWLG